ncbi:MAG: tetratricopeptide repeat protein [Potamolinea sp.]
MTNDSQAKPIRFSRRRFIPLLLASLTVLLCIVSQPVLAQFSRGIPLTQDIPTATQLWQQGREAYENAQFAASVKIWQQASLAYQSQGDREAWGSPNRLNEAMVLSNLALAYQELGQLSEASEAIAKALKILETAPDKLDRRRIFAQVLNTQGGLQMAQGETTAAMITLQQAAATYKQVGDQAGVIRSLLNQAQILRVLGLYRRALTTLTEVNQTLQTQADSPLKATGLRHLGNNLRLIGDLSESQKVLEQSLAIAQKLPSPPDIAATLLSLGNTARSSQATAISPQALSTSSSNSFLTQNPDSSSTQPVKPNRSRGKQRQVFMPLVQPLTQQIQTQLN